MSAKKAVEKTWLVDLDVFLDTRMAVLWEYKNECGVDEAAFAAAIAKWSSRQRDGWPFLDGEDFMVRYNKRGNSVIERPIPTIALPWIRNRILEALSSSAMSPKETGAPVIVINHYPYSLTDAEKKLIANGVQKRFGELAAIRVGSYSHTDLTPILLKESFAAWMCYDFWNWFDTHEELGTFKLEWCPGVTLLAPKIATKSRTAFNAPVAIDPWYGLVELIKPLIDLELLPVSLFSAPVKS